MRKTWALVMAAAMAAASLTACSSSKPAETAAPETEAEGQHPCQHHHDELCTAILDFHLPMEAAVLNAISLESTG